MAVSSYIPQTLAEMKKVNQVTAERWIKDNASWVAAMVAKHDSWIKDNAVDLYQAAYDGELDEIEQRDKARDGGTENKLVSNYVQIIIDTLVDYMLGKSPIYTVEDPDCMTSTHENFEVNHLDSRLGTFYVGNLIDDVELQEKVGTEEYDIVVANILADIIIMIQKQVPFHLKKGGIFISSGIIDMKEEAVKAAFEANDAFEIVEITHQGEWVSVTARKK
mgnify:CR=1 FL=1